MKHNVDSMKPVLLVDISMNNYANIVFNTLLKYDKTLPEGKRNAYFIYKYKELENKYFKKFFRTVFEVEKEIAGFDMEDLTYKIMDSFEDNIKKDLDEIEKILENFIEPDKNDPDNAVLLRKIQMNSIMLQLAKRLNEIYNQKKDFNIIQMLELNTLMTEKVDDRKLKKEYSRQDFDEAVQTLVNKIRDYKYDTDTEMENLRRTDPAERGRIPDGGLSVITGTVEQVKKAVLAAENIRSARWNYGRRNL